MRASNACSVRVRAHARTKRSRKGTAGLLWDLRRSFHEGTGRKNGRESALSVAIATLSRPSIDTRFNNHAALRSPSDNLLSLLFIANFTPPESSRHSARVVITSGNNVTRCVLHGGPTFRVIRISEYSWVNPPVFLANRENRLEVMMDPSMERCLRPFSHFLRAWILRTKRIVFEQG